MIFGRSLWVVVTLHVACAAWRPPPPPDEPPLWPSEPGAATPSTTAAPAPPLAVELDASGVAIAGARVGAEVLALRGALARARGLSQTATLRVAPDLTGPALFRLLQAAGGTALSRVVVQAGGFTSDVAIAPPRVIPDCTITTEQPPNAQLLTASCSQPAAPTKTTKSALTPGDPESETRVRSLLRAACGARPCLVELSLPVDTEHVALLQALQSFERMTAAMPDASLYFRPDLGSASPKLVSGRLPPEIIQRIVLGNGALRNCYDLGLARNSRLRGRVVVRFEINGDGKVSRVSDDGSDLPDPRVVECVLRTFHHFEFPEPEGGGATVVYPFMFTPHAHAPGRAPVSASAPAPAHAHAHAHAKAPATAPARPPATAPAHAPAPDFATQYGVALPGAANTRAIRRKHTANIVLAGDRILVDHYPAGSARPILESGRIQPVDTLLQLLERQRRTWRLQHRDGVFRGVALFWLDAQTPGIVVKSLFRTATLAGYTRLGFAVRQRDSGSIAVVPANARLLARNGTRRDLGRFILHVDYRASGATSLTWMDGATTLKQRETSDVGARAFPNLARAVSQEWLAHGGYPTQHDDGLDQAVLHVDDSVTLETTVALIDAMRSPQREYPVGNEVRRSAAFTVAFAID